ncbi:Diphthamide synthesis DPH1/DPH2 [Trinorchestia longiramus]|nr:Diphthamide synthesis DPH1/DPH2 [Trinorchestia longiramus]
MSVSASDKALQSAKTVKVFRPSRSVLKGIPPEIEHDPKLIEAMNDLPSNYNFEIPKTIWKIKQLKAKIVALQLPEGLQIFAETLSDILQSYCGAVCVNMGDVTYGACCVDDLGAAHIKADLLVHYGHSCLVPIDQTVIPVMYVFVDIQFDSSHFLDTIRSTFKAATPLALVSIVQFVGSLQKLAIALREAGYDVLVPQSRPLSPGEVLGCTSPPLPSNPRYTIVALGDGRFHLESIMISNPELDTYLYNPYNKVLSREYYDQPLMKRNRRKAIDEAAKASVWGIIFSTLGRQGNVAVKKHIEGELVAAKKKVVAVDHDQIYPDLFNAMSRHVDAWVQVACPRLSIDWGHHFEKPLLTPYEAMVALKQAEWGTTQYPMDHYANTSIGPWTPNHVPPCPCGRLRATGCKGRKCDGLSKS